ncbi:adenylate kinase [Luteibacter sp. 22Crub2.1]|uniref:deoxynucleotide monophosphate kinase family protein n=1 Tax=Luteibacter sp. 22Crub2.1 TaxID=1283288 RepID=UPI0009C989CD|nr:adenylate kinase [Luteibacter sp. 22Crub2.1]SKB50576.1 hypothetical protein SAMN05660880_01360 [Luteibacter sp. 22Crub2.1]
MASLKIIGITGRARSGKDTLADALIDASRYGVKMSFADPLRVFVSNITGIPYPELVDGPAKEAPLAEFGGKSPRQMMQTLGTEWGRELIHPDIWIAAARRRLEDHLTWDAPLRPHIAVFADVRFENEAAMIRELGGRIVHLSRPGAAIVSTHVSEGGIEPRRGDVHHVNAGTFADLQALAVSLIT